jgi:hypothetical protein
MATPNPVPFTGSEVNLSYRDNETWQDAFQFGVVGDTSWNITSWTFHMDIKGSKDDANPLFSLTSANGRILNIDGVQRIIQLDAVYTDVQASLKPGRYYYDLIGIDTSVTPVRTVMMYGRVRLHRGVTQS